MGLLVFMRNLLLALCLFLMLGFLYYSAWKLHLLRWEDSSKYGRRAAALPRAQPEPPARRRRDAPKPDRTRSCRCAEGLEFGIA